MLNRDPVPEVAPIVFPEIMALPAVKFIPHILPVVVARLLEVVRLIDAIVLFVM